MNNKILDNKLELLDISIKKTDLLQSIVEHINEIQSNDIFLDEIREMYRDLLDQENELVQEKEITMNCPSCGVECAQIYSYCMVCGIKLHNETVKDSM